jgi:hypothetical protein
VYAISRVPLESEELVDSNGDSGNNGMCDPDHPRVSLFEGLSTEKERAVLCHELSHCIEHHFGLDLPEDLIDAFGRGWLYIIRNNPAVVRYLQRKDYEDTPDGPEK